MTAKATAIENYILAKDGNRPFIIDSAFAEDATLQMKVLTDSIAFPALLAGRDAIANTLVREFNQKYENIYTICIGSHPEIVGVDFSCPWLVVMTEKQSESLRVGCGSYDWKFGSENDKVQSLVITIDTMETASSEAVAGVMNWISGLAYPWCELSIIAKELPNNEEVVRVVRHLEARLLHSVEIQKNQGT